MLIAEQIFNASSTVKEATDYARFLKDKEEKGTYTFSDYSELFIGRDWTGKVCVEARSGGAGMANTLLGRWYPPNS